MIELFCEYLPVRSIWLYVITMLRTDMAPVSSKEFLEIHIAIECRFTLKLVLDMIRTYSQMHRTDKYSQHSAIIWPVRLNG